MLAAGTLTATAQQTAPQTAPTDKKPAEQQPATPKEDDKKDEEKKPSRAPRELPKPNQPAPKPAPAQPATPGERAKPIVSERPAIAPKAPVAREGKLITRSERFDDVVLSFSVAIKLETRDTKVERTIDPKTGKEQIKAKPNEEKMTMPIESMSFIMPYPLRTASSTALGKVLPWDKQFVGEFGYKAKLQVNDLEVDIEPEILAGKAAAGGKGYAGGAQLAKLTFVPERGVKPPTVEATIEMAMRTHDTVFDEAAAVLIPWPTVWPDECSSTLQPQLWLSKGPNPEKGGAIEDYDSAPLAAALKAYLAEEGITDVKSIPPVAVAKLLTGKVWRDIQPTGDGLLRDSAGGDTRGERRATFVSGYGVQAPALTLSRLKGSPFDIVALLTALLHQAGVPARPVIGIDSVGDGQGYSRDSRGRERLRVWLEFAVYDQANNMLNWVPVDVVRLRAQSQRPAKFDEPWKFFGTHDELRRTVPLSLSFSPPTDVAVYAAAAPWGWFVTPKSPEFIDSRIAFSVRSMPKRSGEGPQPVDAPGMKPDGEKPAEKKKDKKLGD
jgi:hypothetical protein